MKIKKHSNYYAVIDQNNNLYIIKYLSKVGDFIQVDPKTISKALNRNGNPFQNSEYRVYRTEYCDLKSYNRGNLSNLSTS